MKELKKNTEEISRRLQMVSEDYEMAKRKEIGFTQVMNGPNIFMAGSIFQKARVDLLNWMVLDSTSAEDINLRRVTLEKELGPSSSSLKYNSMNGLPDDIVLKIALIEQMELALGIHPVQLKR